MKIIHRISVATSKSKELLSVLQANGIHFEENRFVCGFDIGECEDHEKHILELCKAFHATDIVHAEYSQDEYQAASWYTVRSQWHYPNGNEKQNVHQLPGIRDRLWKKRARTFLPAVRSPKPNDRPDKTAGPERRRLCRRRYFQALRNG